MKVKIGKPPGFFGPYQLARVLMFWHPKEKDELGLLQDSDRVYRFGEWLTYGSVKPSRKASFQDEDRPLTWLAKLLYWRESKRKQTVKIKIDPWDTWSMEHTLAPIVLPMLKQLKASSNGAPTVKEEDVPEHITDHFEKWNWVLDEMIFAFDSAVDDSWEEQFESGESDILFVTREDGTSAMVRGPNDTKQYDWEGRRKYQDRIQNGFCLFGKYFQALWD